MIMSGTMWSALVLKPLNHLHTSLFHRHMAECSYSNYYRPPRSLIKWKGRQQLISVTSLSKIKLKCPPVLSTQGSYITVLPASSKLLRSYYRLFCFENPF